jgi:DNA repair protein RadC
MCSLDNEMTDEDIVLKAKEILSRRFLRAAPMSSSTDVADYFIIQLAEKEQEVFCVAFFDSRFCMIDYHPMFYGTINYVFVHAREIVKRALQHNAASVILVHNHPSGSIEISKEDRNLTHTLKAALALVDIDVSIILSLAVHDQ